MRYAKKTIMLFVVAVAFILWLVCPDRRVDMVMLVTAHTLASCAAQFIKQQSPVPEDRALDHPNGTGEKDV
jgi:hypothetical protein